MPPGRDEISLLPSVLDRLIDDGPAPGAGPGAGPDPRRSASVRQLRDAVKRDLEWLLNARRLLVDPPAGAPHLRNSLLTYGLPDFTHANLGVIQSQGELRRVIEEAIARFEPRLSHVSVTLVEAPETERGLRFRIDAVLDVEPTPEAVSFDSVIQAPTNAIVVKEA